MTAIKTPQNIFCGVFELIGFPRSILVDLGDHGLHAMVKKIRVYVSRVP